MPPEQVQVKRKCQRGLTRTRRVRGACRMGALRPRRAGRPEPTRPAGEPGMGRFERSRTGETARQRPTHGSRPSQSPVRGGSRVCASQAGRGRPAGYGATASGHADVTRPCPGHRAPTASVDAPISFTYHLPLCRSTTDIPYVTSSFDAIPRFPEAVGLFRELPYHGHRYLPGRAALRHDQRADGVKGHRTA